MDLTAKRYLPVLADVSVKFTLSHTGFTAEQAVLRFGHSQVDAQAELADFTNPDWKFRYRGWLRLEDLRTILRSPFTPAGRVDRKSTRLTPVTVKSRMPSSACKKKKINNY